MPERPYKRAICWIRRDLRLNDHTALAEATRIANETAVVFVFDRTILDRIPDRRNRRVTFIHQSLIVLDQKLRAQGSQLFVIIGNPVQEIPKIAQLLQADLVTYSRDYEPCAIQRDHLVQTELESQCVTVQSYKDQVTFEPPQLLTNDGNPFRVFSPFKRAWDRDFIADRDAADHQPDLAKLVPTSESAFNLPSLEELGFEEADLWLKPGEDAGRKRLHQFAAKINDYKDLRDFPAKENTSTISVDLRFGTISVREAIRLSLAHPGPGADSWRSELIWREFYQHILFHFPEVETEAFQPNYRHLEYPGSDEHFLKWCQGQTGYPIVDAAMRCLNQTGWMHNRLRMVVASFLTKDLLVDYRKGEAYFREQLIDYDLASNNGGWQWSASTGADPQPYFRIFNPLSQSQKFDPEGDFIRKWVPELADLTAPAIYFPDLASPFDLLTAGVELGKTYPRPIVEHAVQRDRAIALLAGAKNGSA